MPDRDGVLAGRLGAGAISVALIVATLSLGAASAAAKTVGAPVQVTPPALSGSAVEGGKLKAAAGTWSGRKPIHYAYEWLRCDASGQECSPLSGPAKAGYRPTLADVGHALVVRVTASNEEGSASASTPASAPVAPAAPKRRKPGVIAGAAQDGQVLSAGPGTWKGTPPFTFSYQWESCIRRNCEPIAGATEGTYRATTADLGRQLRALVTATNGVGSAQSLSKASEKVLPGPPVSLSAPTVSGTPLPGRQLSVSPGTWAGTGPIEYAYQWRSCNPLGGCSDIAGADQPTYTVGPLDVASSLEVAVTATNAQGAASATSDQTGLIKMLSPSNLGLPSISGLLEDGGLLSALTGAWSSEGPLSFAYQWELCDAAGESCGGISEALASTLKLLPGFVGSTLRVVVTATNSGGSTSATSEPTSLVKALLPSNTSLPSITGLLQDGGLLSALTGSWSGTGPLSYTYQWQQCDAKGEACKGLSGATGATLGLISSLVGSTVRVVVTATNAAGSTQAVSPATNPIAALLPSNTSLPSIAGLLEDGKTLTGASGSWSGTTPIAYAYQWQQCNAKGEECKAIASEGTKETLGLVSGLVKSTVRLVVTATNSGGSAQAASAPTTPVLAALPIDAVAPTISGILTLGQKLLAHHETWTGTAPLAYTYQWQICGLLGLVGECKNIVGATGENLLLELLDVGLTLRVGVTAHNERGNSETAYSKVTGLIAAL